MTDHPAYWATAAHQCDNCKNGHRPCGRCLTPHEYQALVHRDILHLGTRRIALKLGISRAAVRERLHNADRKIAATTRKDAA